MGKLLDLFKGKSPKPNANYSERMEMVYSYELSLLRAYMTQKGQRPEIAKKLKAFNAWRLSNGK